MKRNMKKDIAAIFCLTLLLAQSGPRAQSGGGFEITGSVVAGGGDPAAQGDFALDSTTGQSVAGNAIGSGLFALSGGFWNYTTLAPTAASVSISGRVLTPAGAGLSNALLYLQTGGGELLVARSSSLGYYRFDGIEAGQTVLISVQSKRYTYTPRVVTTLDEISGLDFFPEQ